MVRKLEDLKTPLSEKLVNSMKKIIFWHRINAIAVQLYLNNPCNYEDDLELLKVKATFKLPNNSIVRKEINNIIKRLYRSSPEQPDPLPHASTFGNVINTTTAVDVENEDDLALSMIADDLNFCCKSQQNSSRGIRRGSKGM